jgi:Ca2+-dependent lipid-binding protein
MEQKNLPNKRHIGKQDPYCCVTMNGEKRRTKAIKRGGQHPEWDEEVRFTLLEDVEDELARTANGGDTPPPPPPKNDKNSKVRKIKGGKGMGLSCYADDPREPDLIGETIVDLTEVLTKGETDGELVAFYRISTF